MTAEHDELLAELATLTPREAVYTLLYIRALKRKRTDLCDYLWRRVARRAAA